jgi:hypothetical protein
VAVARLQAAWVPGQVIAALEGGSCQALVALVATQCLPRPTADHQAVVPTCLGLVVGVGVEEEVGAWRAAPAQLQAWHRLRLLQALGRSHSHHTPPSTMVACTATSLTRPSTRHSTTCTT